MATPRSTSRYPGVPHPTPRSTGRAPRAPIHNPYDKFTQPEFDAWINDITGALKRALGREDPPPKARHVDLSTLEDDDDGVEDSFAEIRARRLAKGKERAREEDFEDEDENSYQYENDGWGQRSEEEEYGSSSEEADEEDEEDEVTGARSAEVINLLSDEEDDDEGVEEEQDELEDEPVAGPAPVFDDDDVEEEEGSDAGTDELVSDQEAEEEYDSGGADSDEADDHVQSSPALGPSAAPEVMEILDSDEEQESEEEAPSTRVVPARFLRKPTIVTQVTSLDDESEVVDADPGKSDDEEQAEDEDDPFPPSTHQQEVVDIQDPWKPAAFPEDIYTGGDVLMSATERGNPHTLEAEEEDELADEDATSAQPPEISDPWEGPRTYAEDFYAGGDDLPDTTTLTPSHLTPHDEDKIFIPGISLNAAEHQSPTAQTQEIVNVDDLYADIAEGKSVPDIPDRNAGLSEDKGKEVEAIGPETSPSSSTILNSHFDWNWPPAFPGKVATASGHLVVDEREMLPISDDDDAAPTALADAKVDDTSRSAALNFYADFDIYDMDASGSSLDGQNIYEPVSTNEIDFGDLPPSRTGGVPVQAAALSSVQFDDDALRGLKEAAEAQATELAYPDDTEDLAGIVAPVRETQTPESTLAVQVEEYEDDVAASAVPGQDLDVKSVPDDNLAVSAVELDFVVEEVLTEGRRTEEPETITVEEVADEPTTSLAEAIPIADDTPSGEPVSSPSAPAVLVDTDITSSEYPAPVSADPTVPDPASIAPTPTSPIVTASPARSRGESIASSTGDANEIAALPVHAALLPVLRKLNTAHSPSGLFTPLTEGSSGSVTPELQGDATLIDSKPEVVTTGENIEESDLQLAVEQPLLAADTMPSPSSPSVEVAVDVDVDADHLAVDALTEKPTSAEHTGREISPPIDEGEAESRSDIAVLVTSVPTPTAAPSVATEDRDVGHRGTPGTDVDVDAEGELDSDYTPSDGEVAASTPLSRDEPVALAGTVEDDDPFVVRNVSEPAPSVETGLENEDPFTTPKADQGGESSTNGVHEALPIPAAREDESVADAPHHAEADNVTDSEAAELNASQETVVEESRDEVRPLKRKRRTPPSVESTGRQLRSRKTKSMDMGRSAEPTAPKARNGKGKGKQRARDDTDDEDRASASGSVANSAISGSSSAAAQQLLIPGSRATSRASSVASNAPSTTSAFSLPSPIVMRTLISNGNPLAPPHFDHNQLILRHHHGLHPGVTAVPVIPAPNKRQPSIPPPQTYSETTPEADAQNPPSPSSRHSNSAEPASPAPIAQPPSSRHVVSELTSISPAPVTRANCRYHAISLPREGNGRRLFFAVPGCSLVNGTLMKEESIVDHGYVRSDDISKLVTNVEDLELSPYLVGILRQLVGVDLLREQEVLYLPKPGDNVRLKRSRRHHRGLNHRDSISAAQRESISARTLSKGGAARASKAVEKSSAIPLSQASTSTSGGSASHAGKLSERDSIVSATSFSESELSDLDDEEDLPPTKRAKDAHPEPELHSEHEDAAVSEPIPNGGSSQGPAEEDENASISANTARRKTQQRRVRKLGPDAAAYKPDGGDSDGSDGEEDGTSKKRRRTRRRGVKRQRAEENADQAPVDDAAGKPKRRRVHLAKKHVADADKGARNGD